LILIKLNGMVFIMSEQSHGSWVPIQQIEDWRIGGQADRPYDNPEQAKADILSLLGQPDPGADGPEASSGKALATDETTDFSS
jgi:hypothetical protein